MEEHIVLPWRLKYFNIFGIRTDVHVIIVEKDIYIYIIFKHIISNDIQSYQNFGVPSWIMNFEWLE